jgi:manganese-dependent inorganic pyrophosphatase
MLPAIMVTKKVNMVLVMLTDIMAESTTLAYCGEGAETLVKEAFICRDAQNGSVLVDGLVSRKKQLIPALLKTLTERLN